MLISLHTYGVCGNITANEGRLAVKKCPFCAEEVQDEAVVCKHCKRSIPKKPGKKPTGCLAYFVLFGFIIIFGSICFDLLDESPNSAQQQSINRGALPAVSAYIQSNPNYGSVLGVSDQPDWAQGKRQEVRTTKGHYLFYLKGDQVDGIWEYLPNGQRQKIK